MRRPLAVALVLIGTLAPPALACGADTDCEIEDGSYRISTDGRVADGRAVVFAHGYRGSAEGVMGNAALRRMAAERGAALIALDAADDDWDLPNAPGEEADGRDEMAYLDRVMEDAGRRFGIRREATIVTGFSAGGMFVWNAICARGDAFAAYVPYSGTFWRGPPESCPAPAAPVVHIHGDADETVPMGGRVIADTRQGDVHEALSTYLRDTGGSGAGEGFALADMRCESLREMPRLDLCLFPGGHSFSVERLAAAYDLVMR